MLTGQHYLGRMRTIELLNELEANRDSEARSLYLPSGLSYPEIENTLKEVVVPCALPEGLVGAVAGSKTGACLYWGEKRKYLVLPPFPLTGKQLLSGYDVASLRKKLHTDYRIALVLVRLGAYAVGVCHGEHLVSSKCGTGLVHGRHRKGGSSQGRFQRHREKQIAYFLERVCEKIKEYVIPVSGSFDYVLYGGARTTLQLLDNSCPAAKKLIGLKLPPWLDIPSPRQAMLKEAVKRIWSSYVLEWTEQDENRC